MFEAPIINLAVVLPALIVGTWGVVLMVADMIIPAERRGWSSWLTLVGLLIAGIQVVGLWNYSGGTFISPNSGIPMVIADGYTHFLNLVFIVTGALAVLISIPYLQKADIEEHTEYYMLLLFSICGMMLMGMANDLILIFIALELLSIPLYVMCGIARPNQESEESAMKYFLLGAFASGFLVFGIALLYGGSGSTALPVVAENFMSGGAISFAGLAMLLVGFAFKVGAVPFHMWTPDVYEGAPTAVTAFMSVGAKVGGFAALVRVFAGSLPAEASEVWVPVVAIIAALTMVLGNVVAITQSNVKRMLAYSSIAHGGYMLMAVASIPNSDTSVSSILTYIMAYTFTNLGAFAMVTVMERRDREGTDLEDYKGLAKRNIVLALIMSYFMFSLIGMPLTGGFIGKFVVFRATIDAGLVWLAIVGVLASAVSAYYYLRVIFYMFMFDGEGEVTTSPAVSFAVGISLVATILIGIAPTWWIEMAESAILMTSQMLAAAG